MSEFRKELMNMFMEREQFNKQTAEKIIKHITPKVQEFILLWNETTKAIIDEKCLSKDNEIKLNDMYHATQELLPIHKAIFNFEIGADKAQAEQIANAVMCIINERQHGWRWFKSGMENCMSENCELEHAHLQKFAQSKETQH